MFRTASTSHVIIRRLEGRFGIFHLSSETVDTFERLRHDAGSLVDRYLHNLKILPWRAQRCVSVTSHYESQRLLRAARKMISNANRPAWRGSLVSQCNMQRLSLPHWSASNSSIHGYMVLSQLSVLCTTDTGPNLLFTCLISKLHAQQLPSASINNPHAPPEVYPGSTLPLSRTKQSVRNTTPA